MLAWQALYARTASTQLVESELMCDVRQVFLFLQRATASVERDNTGFFHRLHAREVDTE